MGNREPLKGFKQWQDIVRCLSQKGKDGGRKNRPYCINKSGDAEGFN